jgi:hypothetical protein
MIGEHVLSSCIFLVLASDKPVPAVKIKLKRGHFAQSNCISPESRGRWWIEGIEFSFRLGWAYSFRTRGLIAERIWFNC